MNESALNPPADQDQPGHLSANDLAGFIDQDLDPATRRRVESHLDQCRQCRDELIETQRVAAEYTAAPPARTARSVRWKWVPVALAAGVGVLLLLPRRATNLPAADPTRAVPVADGEGARPISIVSPVDDADVAPGEVVLTWHATAADQYRVSVVTENGDPVWTGETADTTVRPAAAMLRIGQRYFWRVDAIANGITATTGVHRLRIGP